MSLHRMWGTPIGLPEEILSAWPELGAARFRHGGLPLLVSGWLIGARAVDGVTLGRTIWLRSEDSVHDVSLLLHEIRHVQQFASIAWFPWRYVWQSLRHGYDRNRFEIDACAYAARRRASVNPGARG